MKNQVKINIIKNKLLNNVNTPLLHNTPEIFNKKLNKSTIKSLEYLNNDTGKTRHYPPAAQEWFNSIYTFNKNQIKTLPVLDKTLMNLLKGYFNMHVSHKVLKVKRIINKHRRLSPRKIFVGKGELKHTNAKVIITVYLYNTEKMYLIRELKKQFKLLYLTKNPVIIGISKDRKGDKVISYSRPYNLKEFLESPSSYVIQSINSPLRILKKLVTYREIYFSTTIFYVNKLTSFLGIVSQYYYYLSKLVEKNLINYNERSFIFINKIPDFYAVEYPKFNDNINTAKWIYLKKLRRFLYLFRVNIAKSEPKFLSKLAYIVQNMYNKEVEFNIVELNQMHLNSDIYTQAVAMKLKNRKNSLYWVLRSSLTKVDLPNVSRRNERYYSFNRDDLLVNKIRNTYINSMFDTTSNKDSLNKLLLKFFPSSENLEMDFKKRSSLIKLPVSLEIYVLKTLKHLKLAGVRVEAKGRLTKRFTASRSVFKMRWKGGLKNVDSSFKGLSAVMLRGIFKSNVQYSLLNSKNRNGAFGVKGWVSSK